MMHNIKDIIFKIDRIINNCEPNRLFYDTRSEFVKYDKPKIKGDLFGIYESTGFSSTKIDYTQIGRWFEDIPLLISLIIKTPYYIATWPLYLCVLLIWGLFKGVFVPQKWKL